MELKLKNNPHFQKGLRQFKEGKVPEPEKVPVLWVKKFVSAKDWNNYYSQNPTYCFLKKADKGVIVGYLVAKHKKKDRDSEVCVDEELRQINSYYEAHNYWPHPFDKMEL